MKTASRLLAAVICLLFLSGCLTLPKTPDALLDRTTKQTQPRPQATKTPSRAEAVSEAQSLEAKLKQSPPVRDLASLASRLRTDSGRPSRLAENGKPLEYSVGQVSAFWVGDQQKRIYFPITATLQLKTSHAYFYVEEGQELPPERLQEAGETFEREIYPAVRGYFGGEADRGADGDSHITILNANLPGSPGYFSSADEYPSSVNPYSNERAMIYINMRLTTVGSKRYYSILAHEFQHMIHWNQDRGEDTWVNEGLSELAVKLAGFTPTGSESYFIANPDTQLNVWAADSSAALPHYGAAYLFLSYLAEHYGGYRRLKDLVAEKAHGINGVERYLAKEGFVATFDDVFKDWVIANYLDDSQFDGGRYGYKDVDVHVKAKSIGALPSRASAAVNQYAADYLDLGELRGDYAIAFTGTTTVKLLANDARSGKRQWWSNRGDGIDTTLTREFDMTGLDKATLVFSAWYDVEKDYDYAYVEISKDGGATWSTLRGWYSTEGNPNGNNLGAGYTGKSGGGQRPQWIDERIDLSPYARQKVLIRFEYVTDDAYSGPGFAVDDISIPELNYNYDAESEENWVADGFILSSNLVPQRYFAQIVKSGRQPSIETMPLDDARRGQLIVHGDGSGKVVLIVAAAAPATSEAARYEYSVQPLASGRAN